MIEVQGLTKIYGTHAAVDHINFTVNDGEIVGFLGPNGAGKTTTMNMMTGFISSTEGSVKINGFDILDEPEKAKKQLGYLPDVPPLYGDMRVTEYLDFVCDIKGVPKDRRPEMLKYIMETVKITDHAHRIVKNLSKGYRQRVGLAQAMVGFPKVLILDEPTVGLDPKQIIEMRDVIRALGKRHTVILSSHILGEVSAVCDRIIIINKGKIVADAPAERLTEGTGHSAQIIRVNCEKEKAEEIVKNISAVKEYKITEQTDEIEISVSGDGDIRAEVSKAFAKADIPLLMLKPAALTLEEIFLKIISGETPETYTAPAENKDIETDIENEEKTGEEE
ncbi:MAG: ABC transporter ATP-binding protein [Firmicutes bacterium]|nr:ABC transporter ATP-binding protein [Bacillota bacterium]